MALTYWDGNDNAQLQLHNRELKETYGVGTRIDAPVSMKYGLGVEGWEYVMRE